MKTAILCLPLLFTAAVAGASTDSEWAKFDRRVTQRCAADSKLIQPRVSKVVGFDDSLGKVATLVTGRESVRARRGSTLIPATRLCIFDKRSGRTWIDEAQGWTAPARR